MLKIVDNRTKVGYGVEVGSLAPLTIFEAIRNSGAVFMVIAHNHNSIITQVISLNTTGKLDTWESSVKVYPVNTELVLVKEK